VFINGERIVYYYKDNVSNTLGQLRRGTNGTGAINHYIGNVVYDAGQNQTVIQSDNYLWYPGLTATGTVNLSATSNLMIGTGTAFTTELTVGANVFVSDGRYIGQVSRINSDTSARVISPVGFNANTVSFEYAANITKTTTSSNTFTFYSNTGYVRSNLWYSRSNAAITTEDNDILTTESGNILIIDGEYPTNGSGLFNSNTIQVNFLKQGL